MHSATVCDYGSRSLKATNPIRTYIIIPATVKLSKSRAKRVSVLSSESLNQRLEAFKDDVIGLWLQDALIVAES